MGSWSKICGIIITLGIFGYSYLVRRNGALGLQNDILIKEKEDIKGEAEKIVTIQKRQAEIASVPSPSRADLYKQLRILANRNKA